MSWLKEYALGAAANREHTDNNTDDDATVKVDDEDCAASPVPLHVPNDPPLYISDPLPVFQRRPFTTLADHPRLQHIINGGPARKKRCESLDASRQNVTAVNGDSEIHPPAYNVDTATLQFRSARRGSSTAPAQQPARPTSEPQCAEHSCFTPRVRPRRQTSTEALP